MERLARRSHASCTIHEGRCVQERLIRRREMAWHRGCSESRVMSRSTTLIELPGSGDKRGAGSEKIAAVLNAQCTAERWSARRVFSGRAVIWISAAMAYMVAVQTGCATSGARLILGSWAAAFASLVACALAEARAQRRVD